MNRSFWIQSNKIVASILASILGIVGLMAMLTMTQQPVLANSSTLPHAPTLITDTIAYSRFISATSGHEVRFVNIDGTGDISITIGWRPRISPDNNFIAFHHDGIYPSGLGDNVYVKDLATQTITRVTNNSDYIVSTNWSTDSQHILLDQSCTIYRINRDGSNPINLTNNHNCYDDAPSVNPLSGRIAFHNQFSGLYTMNADGSNIQHIPNTQANDWLALWSWDGQWLSFLRGANYYKIRPDGTGLAQLTFSTAVITGINDYNPDVPWSGAPWSSDDRSIVGPRTVNGIRGIYAIATDGSGAMTLVLPSAAGTWVDSVGTVVGNPLATVLLSIGLTGNGGGIVTANPSGPSYIQGTVITLTATPLITSTFTGWSGSVVTTTNPIAVTMTGDKAITATFALNTFVITPTASANGSLTPATPQTVAYGASQTFTITPNIGYHIVDVGVDGLSQGAVSSYTFTNVMANHTLTASFAINTYTITPTTGVNGSITPGTLQTVNHGSSITFTIAANTGYHIVDVGVDGLSQGPIGFYAFTNVTADHTITAAFAINAPNTYTLTVNYAGNGLGSVTLNPSGLSYVAGTVVTLTATPLITSTFTGWGGSVVTTTNPSTVTMTGDKAVTATFEIKQYYVDLPLVIR